MGQCEYADGFLDGYHCKNHNNDKVPRDMVEYYCTMYTQCSHCPWRGGDDGPRLRDQREADRQAQEARDEADRQAKARLQHDAYDYSENSSDGNGSISGGGGGGISGGGGGGGSLGCSGWSSFLLFLILCAAVFLLVWLGDLFGWLGPWATMRVPPAAVTEDLRLYSISMDSGHYFEVRSEKFKDDGSCSLRTEYRFNEVYLEQDKASVWIGQCDLLALNTGIVYDYTYEEAEALMLRPLLIQLQDTAKVPLDGLMMEIFDARGTELPWIALGDGLYAVFLPNDAADQSLTLQAAGYLDRHIPFKGDARLSKVIVTMA
ncbi:MAG: hypothetical protein IJY28_09860 [Clostridia bacterium]|nr:hypothetical protein [Clostridia bacterium]